MSLILDATPLFLEHISQCSGKWDHFHKRFLPILNDLIYLVFFRGWYLVLMPSRKHAQQRNKITSGLLSYKSPEAFLSWDINDILRYPSYIHWLMHCKQPGEEKDFGIIWSVMFQTCACSVHIFFQCWLFGCRNFPLRKCDFLAN